MAISTLEQPREAHGLAYAILEAYQRIALKLGMDSEGSVGRRTDIDLHHTYIYTQRLSDGSLFVQGLAILGNGNSRAICKNPSLEAYTDERKWWISETLEELAALGYENEAVVDIMHSLPEKLLEVKENQIEDEW